MKHKMLTNPILIIATIQTEKKENHNQNTTKYHPESSPNSESSSSSKSTKTKNRQAFQPTPVPSALSTSTVHLYQHIQEILACNNCQNLTCYNCITTYEKRYLREKLDSKKQTKKMRCPFCNSSQSLFVDYDKEEKKYFDSTGVKKGELNSGRMEEDSRDEIMGGLIRQELINKVQQCVINQKGTQTMQKDCQSQIDNNNYHRKSPGKIQILRVQSRQQQQGKYEVIQHQMQEMTFGKLDIQQRETNGKVKEQSISPIVRRDFDKDKSARLTRDSSHNGVGRSAQEEINESENDLVFIDQFELRTMGDSDGQQQQQEEE